MKKLVNSIRDLLKYCPPKHYLASKYTANELESMHKNYFSAQNIKDREKICKNNNIPSLCDLYNLMAWYSSQRA